MTLLIEHFVEVVPVGVHLTDQLELPRTTPLLDRLLARNRLVDAVVELVPDEAVDAIMRAETAEGLGLVLPHAAADVARDAEIQRAVAFARDEINVIRHGVRPR